MSAVKPVAWAAVDDTRNGWAFAWEGSGRRPWHSAPLYGQDAIDQLTAERDFARKEALFLRSHRPIARRLTEVEAERDVLASQLGDVATLLMCPNVGLVGDLGGTHPIKPLLEFIDGLWYTPEGSYPCLDHALEALVP